MTFGRWPEEHIDHRNRDTADNRLANLRECSRSQNMGNSKVSCNNRLNMKGVRLHKWGKYSARIRDQHLGMFDTVEEAAAAYAAAAAEAFGPFARTK
jgi:hypothetical protein